jgi:hypothetical protein
LPELTISDRALLATLVDFDEEHGGFPLAAVESELASPFFAMFYAAEDISFGPQQLRDQVERLRDRGVLRMAEGPASFVGLPDAAYFGEPGVVIADEWIKEAQAFDYQFDDLYQQQRAIQFVRQFVFDQTAALPFTCRLLEELPPGWNLLPDVEVVLDDEFVNLTYGGPSYDAMDLVQGTRIPDVDKRENARDLVLNGLAVQAYEVQQTSVWADVIYEWVVSKTAFRLTRRKIHGVDTDRPNAPPVVLMTSYATGLCRW